MHGPCIEVFGGFLRADSILDVTHRCDPGSIATIASVVEFLDPETVLLITGGRSFEASGAAGPIGSALTDRTVTTVAGVTSDPTIDDLEAAIEVYRTADPDLVIAVGGGSVLDLAKAVRTIAPWTPFPRQMFTGKRHFDTAEIPLVAIPTTAGSGSEVTRYAVFTVDGVKQPIGHHALLPSDVILDPDLTASVPPDVAASTGLDAFAHGMESMWSTNSDAASYELASTALGLAVAHLERAVNRPDDATRCAMVEASHLAGHAIDRSATTAPHAFSFHLTTELGVPHGHAVALTLGPVLEFVAGVGDDDCADERGPDHVRGVVDDILGILGVPDPAAGRVMITELIDAVGLEPTLHGVGMSGPARRSALAMSAPEVRMRTTPRRFTDSGRIHLIAGIT